MPEAAVILQIPLHKIRFWTNGYSPTLSKGQRAIVPNLKLLGSSRDRAFNFLTLIEMRVIMAFRESGISFHKVRQARQELITMLGMNHPFAYRKLLYDKKKIYVVFDGPEKSTIELGTRGQAVFHDIISNFCKKIDFSNQSELAERFWPLGRDKSIVVDPHHAFGHPVIHGTNIFPETIFNLHRAGETKDAIINLYDITETQYSDSIEFAGRKAA